ncbi:MAG TPA: hypothetical protein VH436_11885 [Vicinamibacterales bacterium]
MNVRKSGVISSWVLLSLAVSLPAYLHARASLPPVHVHVRWAPDVSASERNVLEQRFQLTDGEFLNQRTWSYRIANVRRSNVAAILAERRVEDTDGIDRSALRVTEAPGSFEGLSTALPLGFGVSTLLFVGVGIVRSRTVSRWSRRAVAALAGVPRAVLRIGASIAALFASCREWCSRYAREGWRATAQRLQPAWRHSGSVAPTPWSFFQADAAAGEPSAHRSFHIILLALLPWGCLAFNGDWIYSSHGTVDPWIYHGYFHRFPEFVSTLYPGTYYGTRLGWIVPGYVAYLLFPPHVANFLLHLGLYYLATFAVYRIVALLADRSSALLAAVAFGTFGPILIALGWDYVDGAVIAYSTVAWACLMRAARSPLPTWSLVAAGAASAFMVHSNLGSLILVPGLLISYACIRGRERFLPLVGRGGAWLAGVALVTVILSAVDAWAGGPWLFFMPSVRWAAGSVGVVTFDQKTLLSWISISQLVLPVLGAVAALSLVRRRTSLAAAAAAPILFGLALFAVNDGVFKGGLLQTDYYVSWLLAPAIVALVAVSSSAGSLVRSRAIAFVAVICALNWLVVPRLKFHGKELSRVQFDLVQQTLRFVSTQVPIERGRPIFWLEPGPAGMFAASLASTHLYLYSLAGEDYPKLPDDITKSDRAGAAIHPGSMVVIVSHGEPNPSAIEREFARFGLSAQMGAREQIQAERVQLLLSVVDVGKLGATASTDAEHAIALAH